MATRFFYFEEREIIVLHYDDMYICKEISDVLTMSLCRHSCHSCKIWVRANLALISLFTCSSSSIVHAILFAGKKGDGGA